MAAKISIFAVFLLKIFIFMQYKTKHMYKIYCILVPKRPEIKTKLIIEASSFKEALDILRKDHNIFEENVYKITISEKKKSKHRPFDWTISEFSRFN